MRKDPSWQDNFWEVSTAKVRDFLLQQIKACQPRHRFVTTLQVAFTLLVLTRISIPAFEKQNGSARLAVSLPGPTFTLVKVWFHQRQFAAVTETESLPEFGTHTLAPSKAMVKGPFPVACLLMTEPLGLIRRITSSPWQATQRLLPS